MARVQSPGYPSISLQKALPLAQKIFDQDRRNPIDRAVAAKHIGYAGLSGASDKTLAGLAHYGLTEKTGKGEIRISQRAVDILYPDKPEDRLRALREAAFSPNIFNELRERFNDGAVSESAIQSYLKRENFLDRAIGPVTQSYLETCRYLEQEKAFESGGNEQPEGPDSLVPEHGGDTVYGGAKVGDLIQWEINGALQMEKPMRVRLVTDDGWVAVEGSETGIPMDQVIVEERGQAPAPAPMFKLADNTTKPSNPDETEWMRNKVGKGTTVSLLVSGGAMGAKEIGKLITLLEAQRAVLDDEDEDD